MPLLRQLPPDLHVVAVNLQGRGLGEQRSVGATQHAVADRVELFMSAIQLEHPVLAGHSHGGTLALRLAAEHPDDFAGLVLLAPAHPFSHHATGTVRFWGTVPGFLLAHSLRIMPRWMLMVAMRRMAGPDSLPGPELLEPYRNNLRERGTVNYLRRLLTTWHDDMVGLRDLLAAPLATPALLIWGDHDSAVPHSTAEDLRTHLSDSKLCIVRGCGHNPAEDRPEACADLIVSWMRERGWMLQDAGESENSSVSQSSIAERMRASLEPGESGVPLKK